MPFDFVKKTMMTGIGIALRTQSELETLAKEFIDQNKLSEEEGKKFVDELSEKYEESKKKLEERVEKLVKEAHDKTDIASKSDIKALREEMAELRKKLDS